MLCNFNSYLKAIQIAKAVQEYTKKLDNTPKKAVESYEVDSSDRGKELLNLLFQKAVLFFVL